MLKDVRGEVQGPFHKGAIYMIYSASKILLHLLIFHCIYHVYIHVFFKFFWGVAFSCLTWRRDSTNRIKLWIPKNEEEIPSYYLKDIFNFTHTLPGGKRHRGYFQNDL